MPDQLQLRGGTTAQHTSFTGASKEVTVDTTKKTAVVHDGSTVGGVPLLREDGSNSALTLGSAGTPSIKFTGDTNTGIYSPGADQVAVATNGTGRLFVDANGNVKVGSTDNSNAASQYITVGSVGVTDGGLQLWATTTGQSFVQFGDTTTSADQYRGYLKYSHASDFLALGTASQERLRVTSAGLVGIGNSSPQAKLHVNTGTDENLWVGSLGGSGAGVYLASVNDSASTNQPLQIGSASVINFAIAGTEAARIDSSRRLLVGTSTAFDTAYIGTNYQIGIEKLNTYAGFAMKANFNNADGCYILMAKSRGSSLNTKTVVNDGDNVGAIVFEGADGTNMLVAARITCFIDGTPSVNDMPGRLVFSTTADGASTPTERMRITSGGNVLIGKTTAGIGNAGIELRAGNQDALFTNYGATAVFVNRTGNDGVLIDFQQDGTSEGTISVSGTTVSYNGAHLSRWSQLPSGAERTEILRGSVLSNIDEMCEWGEEDNEQLNRIKVSTVEGDKNVSGVFQSWDDDDDTYTNDFYCAMTGDFIIRIAEGVIVERGDLLMSAGDGTAKPQDDDIIRSKTIAKVTSTNVTCTYDDGSYCVPCVLMAC